VDPWGKVLLDMGGEAAGFAVVDLDLGQVARVRAQIPSLVNERAYSFRHE
jgi:predicted amidohydrolase